MADDQLSDSELAAELKQYGEIVQLPMKFNKRQILLKKLNHFRAKSNVQNGKQSSKSPSSNSWNRSPEMHSIRNVEHSSNLSPAFYPNVNDGRTVPISNAIDVRKRSHGFETQSSDDSDFEHVNSPSSVYSTRSNHVHGQSANHASARDNRERKRSSQLTDSVLRTLRRRTAEPLPRNTQKNRIPEKNIDSRVNNSQNDGSDGEISVPSPARSRLYNDIRKMNSFLSKSNDNEDKFESSDSDRDDTAVTLDSKGPVNTSFSLHDTGSHITGHAGYFSSTPSPYLNSSVSLYQRAYRRNYINGPHRVQQYKSRYLEVLPQVLVGVAAMFFIALFVTYIVIHKDFFFSWFSSSSNIGLGDHLIICRDGIPTEECYAEEEVKRTLHIIKRLFDELSSLKGRALCSGSVVSDVAQKATVLRDKIRIESVAQSNADRLFVCCLKHIIANPHWNIKARREDGSLTTNVEEVFQLESEVAIMTWFCRLQRSISTVVYGLCIVAVVIAVAFLFLLYIKYTLKQRELQQKEVYAMVERIIDILQDHYEQTKGDESIDVQYLAIQHVRDRLLHPSQRRKLQPVWDKAVEFIAANESRVRQETRIINGKELQVWHWLQPVLHNGKIWQGQAFGKNSENMGSNQVIYSPTPCLKIRNMFDSNVENGDNWESSVTDAILEKCRSIDSIVHIYVDVSSKEGCVYLKCSSCEAAGKARCALHGWWFDGRLVTVKHLKLDYYHKRWPAARDATKPLRPSTNQMRSLSQPYYRSSLEIT